MASTTNNPEKRIARLFAPEYLSAQAARHVEWLRRLGIHGDHGVACLTRVPGWPCPDAPRNHLRQTCPCGAFVEARGDFCSRCRSRTGPQDWHDRATTPGQRFSTEKARAARWPQKAPTTDTSGPEPAQSPPAVTRRVAHGPRRRPAVDGRSEVVMTDRLTHEQAAKPTYPKPVPGGEPANDPGSDRGSHVAPEAARCDERSPRGRSPRRPWRCHEATPRSG